MGFPLGERREAGVRNYGSATINSVTWNFGAYAANMVESYTVTALAAVRVPKTNFITQGPRLPYFAAAPGNFNYSVRTTFTNADPVTEEGYFPELAPTLSGISPEVGDFAIRQEWLDEPGGGRQIDIMQLWGDGDVGFSFIFQATLPVPTAEPNFATPTGKVACFQTVLSERIYTPRHGDPIVLRTPDYVLDTSAPYAPARLGADGEDVDVEVSDSPYTWLPRRGFSRVRMNDRFRTYAMYQSRREGSIWVCLGRVEWQAVCQADQAADDGPWVLSADDSSIVQSFVVDRIQPVWACNIRTYNAIFDPAVRAAAPAEAAALPSWLSVSGSTPSRPEPADRRLYRVNVNSFTTAVRQALAEAMDIRPGPVTGGAFLAWMAPDRVPRVQAVAGVSFVTELPVVDRYPQTRAGRVPNFAGETEYLVSVAPACFANGDGSGMYWQSRTETDLTTLRKGVNRAVAPRAVSCERAEGYGRYRIRFTSPPGEAGIRSIAQLPYVHSIELKQHFSPGPGPVGPNLQ
jgi:hypothetical protein